MSEQSPGLPESIEYAGFWARLLAAIVDTVVLVLITLPLTIAIYGNKIWESDDLVIGSWDIVINWILPAVIIILFWCFRGATPGKMITRMNIVDAQTGALLSVKQSLVRYIGYIISTIPFCLGFIWIGFDKKKQGWHDKLAGTVVVKLKKAP